MGLHFYKSYWNGVAHFQDFWGQKIQVCRDLKIERFTPHQVSQKCGRSFYDVLVNRLYKVDA